MRRISNGAVAAGIAATAALGLLAGCGSSSHTSTGTSASTGTSGASTPSGTPIAVGFIASASGAQAASEGGTPQVFNAWVKSVNDAGGINGHPLKGYVKDDAGVAATALTAVKELVEGDHVVAIVGDNSNQDVAWASYVQAKGVPVVGGLGSNLPMVSNPDFFPSGTNVIAAVYGSLKVAATYGNKFGLLYCSESPSCAQSKPLFQGLGQAVGVTVPLALPVSGSAPDYTAVCQALKSSGAQSYDIASSGAVVLRIYQACKQQGVTAKLVGTDGTIGANFASALGTDLLGVDYNAPWFADSTPATKAYRDFLAKYVPNLGSFDGSNSSNTYVSGKLFEAAVKAAGTDTITAASVKQGLYALKGETLGGLTQPITYTQDKPTALNCWFNLTAQNGKFALTSSGLTPECAPDAVISGVLKQLG